ncbi:MAG TPA: trypsin-like serine protease [Bacteriovoracaceae bacterium]|nr:trypsin-like serine protease [Bacteriovoracaceae bacterium]
MSLVIAKDQQWELFNSSLLLEVTRPNGVFTCSGVAISQDTVLTAAHCLDGEVKQVKVFDTVAYDPKATFFEIASSKIHPDYNPKVSAYLNDIAIIKLKTKLPNHIIIHPVYQKDDITGEFIRFGFGERDEKNNRTVVTPKFRYVNHPHKVIELDDYYSKSGDSGGPVFLIKDKTIYILAIHSTLSKGSQGEFSYNPLVNKYWSWINSETHKSIQDPIHQKP